MARPGNGPPEPDLYQLLGVARQATPAEITQPWRRRARAEHPDARPLDVGAPSLPSPLPAMARARQVHMAQVAARYLDDVREWPW